MRMWCRGVVASAALVLLPAVVLAQASITGSVKDTSGAVLPGVTVEAASPALIEKVRAAVTDGSGQYRIEDLRPGTYTVTFKLTGFSTVQRQDLELTGAFAARVDAELRVGALEETITVTGESPVVDVVNAKKQSTMTNETIAAVPTARLYHSLATLIPGVTVSGNQDVGGLAGPVTVTFAMRGGPGNEGRLTVDGLSLGASLNGTGVSYTVADVGNAQEVVFTTAGGLGESEVGGPAMNLVPRVGGNRFSGTFFANGANDNFQTSNYTDEIRASGLAAPQLMKKIWDVNGAIGGPILRDKLWFFSAVRHQGNRKTVSIFKNANENDLNAWHYVRSTEQASDDGTWKSANVRLTLQASPRNKFNFYWDEQRLCTSCESGGNATTSPEARGNNHAPPRVQQITWSSPTTNRLLLESGIGANLIEGYGVRPNISNFSRMIPVQELCTAGCAGNGGIQNLLYRSNQGGGGTPYIADSRVLSWRGAASFVTGRNSMKAGYIGQFIVNHFPNSILNDEWITYSFNDGRPASFTQTAGPARFDTELRTDALYVQDQWTAGRLTLSGAIRFDHTSGFFPEQRIGPNPHIPVARVIPATDGTSYSDITPRLGAVYDVFGNGKTALKVNLGKYLAAADGSSITGALTNPLNRITLNSGARNWIDANNNYRVDCDLRSMAAQDLRASGGDSCGAGSATFGQTAAITTTYDPEILNGWGIRPYDWNFGMQVQQELFPRVSVDVGYFRRSFGNFTVTDNRAFAPSDFDRFSIVAPSDPRLPGGGGYVVGELYNVRPEKFGQQDNFVTMASNYGKRSEQWNGVEVNFTARVRNGLTLQGGTSTGRLTADSCEVRAQVPEMTIGLTTLGLLNPYCHSEPPFRTQIKGVASYMIPRVDVQLSAAVQSLPGSSLNANYTSVAAMTAALGRAPTGGINTLAINLVEPGQVFGDRINQIDLRIGKLVRFAGLRSQFSVDIYNALNSSAIQPNGYNQAFIPNGNWLVPTSILPARFAKLTAQIDF
jgi:hypothetical protein